MSVGQVLQVSASLCVLIPFVLVQLGQMDASSRGCLLLNLVGSATLAVDAATGQDWGFLLLEAVWALVSLTSLIRGRDRTSDRANPTLPSTGRP